MLGFMVCQIVSDVSEERRATILRVKHSSCTCMTLKVETLLSSVLSETVYPSKFSDFKLLFCGILLLGKIVHATPPFF